ncbi:hypothetical protein [Flavobacterium limi]|uniref:Outer membrane protein beta-barrel domain-containing protein n=1 Tax=Flavobacterium limi TaxID=2045105 RepID=A0ABQ1TLY4_9FLAO|nr:hypothetical protein [Flavobacterium limi]GGE97127.1 hypothetical protein GCM10011518_03070 [Flavobacterium limi]
MKSTLRCLIIIFFTIFLSNQIKAQTTGKFIKASIGLGYSYSDYDEKGSEYIEGSGFYTQGEYVIGVTKWFSVRPYAGLILTSTDEDNNKNPEHYKVTSKAFLIGGKARICAPIPWVAPFIESGIGASIGSFETYTPLNNIKKNGVLMHIPFTLGLAVGRKNNIDIAFTYYFHSAADQFNGAFAAGFSFPID